METQKQLTCAAADSAEWVRPRAVRTIRLDDDHRLRVADTSGYPWFGYSYALAMQVRDCMGNWVFDLDARGEVRPLCSAVEVWVTDGNPSIGRPGSGAFCLRFRRADLDAAISAARAAIAKAKGG